MQLPGESWCLRLPLPWNLMKSFTIVFTFPGTNGARRPGWTKIEECVDINDAIDYFLTNRGQNGIPSDAEIDTVKPA